LNLVRATGEAALKMSASSMSDDFDGLDAMEKAGIGATLVKCRVLASQNCERTA
jgi:hypothetical protein